MLMFPMINKVDVLIGRWIATEHLNGAIETGNGQKRAIIGEGNNLALFNGDQSEENKKIRKHTQAGTDRSCRTE